MDLDTITSVATPAPGHGGVSMLALFLQADWVVKSVMIGLVFASVWSCAIII